jgi:hypothetical protein
METTVNDPMYTDQSEKPERPQRYGLAMSSLVCGIIGCAFNLLFITAVFGIPLGIIALVLGASSYKNHHYGKAGLILGLLSFLVVFVYLFSYVAVMIIDPFT